jgi:hypothetical protein
VCVALTAYAGNGEVDDIMSGSGALAYWFDIKPEITVDWLDWYLHDHMPSRVGTTFVSGRCYEAIRASRSHMVLFETTSPEALLAPSYLALLKVVSPEDRQRRGWYANTIRVTCRVPARRGRGTGSVLGVVRIGGASVDRARLGECLANDAVSAVAGVNGIGSVWLLEHDPAIRSSMDEVRVTGHQDGSADWALLIEAADERHVMTAAARLNDVSSWTSLVLADAVTFDCYRLLYTMTQADRE